MEIWFGQKKHLVTLPLSVQNWDFSNCTSCCRVTLQRSSQNLWNTGTFWSIGAKNDKFENLYEIVLHANNSEGLLIVDDFSNLAARAVQMWKWCKSVFVCKFQRSRVIFAFSVLCSSVTHSWSLRSRLSTRREKQLQCLEIQILKRSFWKLASQWKAIGRKFFRVVLMFRRSRKIAGKIWKCSNGT